MGTEVLEDGGKLIKFKDDLHTMWYELQLGKRSTDKYALLEKPLYDKIVALGHQTLDYLTQLDPENGYIRLIAYELHNTELQSWVAEDIAHAGRPPKPFYVMKPGRAQDVITKHLNKLANHIHNAGWFMLKQKDEYAGCSMSATSDKLTSINTGVLKYCTGALMRNGKRRAWLHNPGNKIEHRMGEVHSHAMVLEIEPTEKGYDVDIDYTESGDSNWQLRRDGVKAFITGKGGNCLKGDYDEQFVKCTMKDASELDIQDLALMASQLKDIDLISSDCIPTAFEAIKKQAEGLKLVEPETDIWKEPWKVATILRSVEECRGEVDSEMDEMITRDEARRERERQSLEDIATRAERVVTQLVEDVRYMIAESTGRPCVFSAYQDLYLADNYDEIMAICREHEHDQYFSPVWCEDLAKMKKDEVQEAARELVSRCPPEGIIYGLEAERIGPNYKESRIAAMEDVCMGADAKDCLNVIKQVRTRIEKGEYPGTLALSSY